MIITDSYFLGDFALADTAEKEQNYRLVVYTLKSAVRLVIEDYPVEVGTKNRYLLEDYLSIKLARQLRQTLRDAFKFLENLTSSKKYKFRHFKPWAQTFYQWQKSLLPYHLKHMASNPESYQIHFGLCLHYVLDALYHFFKTFMGKKVCKACPWCGFYMAGGWWGSLYHLQLEFFIPGIYKHLTLCHTSYLEKEKPSRKELHEGLLNLLSCVEQKLEKQTHQADC